MFDVLAFIIETAGIFTIGGDKIRMIRTSTTAPFDPQCDRRWRGRDQVEAQEHTKGQILAGSVHINFPTCAALSARTGRTRSVISNPAMAERAAKACAAALGLAALNHRKFLYATGCRAHLFVSGTDNSRRHALALLAHYKSWELPV